MSTLHQKWIVVTSVAAIGFVIAGSGAAVVGPVFSPLMKELGWSNGETSALATAFITGGLLSISPVGILLDRYGARSVMAVGALVTVMGLFWASHCHSWTWMVAAFALAGIGFSASFYLPSAVVVTNWMYTQRSLGMGIVMGAMSAGAAVFSPLIGWWTESHGWRSALESVAALIALMLPLILLTVRTRPPGQMLNLQDSLSERSESHATRRDLLSPAFILAIASGVFVGIGMFGIYFHVVPLLIKAGYSAHVAGLAFGSTWLISTLGSLGLGVIADRLGAKLILEAALFACAFGTLLLLGAAEVDLGISCVVGFALLWGASANSFGQLAPVIFAERFGSRSLGTLVGLQAAIAGVAGAAAPVVTGLIYDKFGSYNFAIAFSASATLVGFILILLIRAPKHGDAEIANHSGLAKPAPLK